jgi:hypothetical protein
MPIFEIIPEIPRGTTGAMFFFYTGLKKVVEKVVELFNQNDDSWIVPRLLNSWQHFGEPYQGASYRKDMMDRVYLTGTIKSGTPGATSVAFTLPSLFRPKDTLVFPVATDSATDPARVHIDKNGQVIVVTGSTTLTSLDGIAFRIRPRTRPSAAQGIGMG